MRYSREHKLETHARIVKKASVRLREKGAHGIGVADLMKDAGLTHGGFYAHFDSREALVIEAFNYAMDRSTERWRKLAEATPPEKRLAVIVDSYLTDPSRRSRPWLLAADARPRNCPREPEDAQGVRDQAGPDDRDAGGPDSGTAAQGRAQAGEAAIATMLGTLVLARIAGSGEFSDEVLEAGRDAALGGAVPPKPAVKKSRARPSPAAGS